MEISDWIALGVGSYAAIVASAALGWNILRERHRVTVSVKYAFGVGGMEGGEWVSIEVVNNGRRSINIQEVGFQMADGGRLINFGARHDFGWLKDGDGKSFYVPKEDIPGMNETARERGTRIVAAYVRDSTSKYYRGKISRHSAWFNL